MSWQEERVMDQSHSSKQNRGVLQFVGNLREYMSFLKNNMHIDRRFFLQQFAPPYYRFDSFLTTAKQ
jgi:hypothetical protein